MAKMSSVDFVYNLTISNAKNKRADGRKVFQDFLRCEYSEENILFWIACEELKNEKDSKSVAAKARDIYEDYISILSAKEVS